MCDSSYEIVLETVEFYLFTNNLCSYCSGTQNQQNNKYACPCINSGLLTCRIVKDIANRQRSGGFLLLTGIVNENAEQVKECYTEAGYTDFEQKIDNEWTIWSAKMK